MTFETPNGTFLKKKNNNNKRKQNQLQNPGKEAGSLILNKLAYICIITVFKNYVLKFGSSLYHALSDKTNRNKLSSE